MMITVFKAIRAGTIACLVTLAMAGVSLAQQARVRSVQQLLIEDSKGKVVGRTIGGVNLHNIESKPSINLDIRTIVLLQVEQNIVPVMVGRDRFYGGAGLLYEAENCLGTPWLSFDNDPNTNAVETDAPSLLPQVAIGPPGQTIYMAIPGAAPRPITIRSILEFGRTCRNQTFLNIREIPAQPLGDLLTVFTPPFSLRAAP